MDRQGYHHGNLPAALIAAGLALLEDLDRERSGLDAFSLRAVARRAGVSPAAVYRHFADKTDLLAALAAEGFARLNAWFAGHVAAEGPDPTARLLALGEAYLAFAADHPALYRLMFTRMGEALRDHPRLAEEGGRAFATLGAAVAACHGAPSMPGTIAAWSLVHGFAMLRLEGVLSTLPPAALPGPRAVLTGLLPPGGVAGEGAEAVADALRLRLIAGRFAVLRLPPDQPLPLWLDWRAPLVSVTRTGDELSILCPEADVPAILAAERGFRALRVEGRLDFALTGILARLSGALAVAGVSLFAVSTHDTDWLLVRVHDLARALSALRLVAAVEMETAEG